VSMVFDDDSSAAWNEMFSAPGSPRPIYERLFAELGRYQPAELRQRPNSCPTPSPSEG